MSSHTFPDLKLDFRPVQTVALSRTFSPYYSSSSPSRVILVSISDLTLFNSNSTRSMANPATARFSALILLFSLLVNITSADPPFQPPSPTPQLSPNHSPNIAPASNPSPANPSNAPTPVPSTPDSPTPSSPGSTPSPSPVPSPADVSDGGVNHNNVSSGDGKSSSRGMSSGKKAGIAVGVVVAAGAVAFGALVYKKRRQNIQRSQYGYSARRELL